MSPFKLSAAAIILLSFFLSTASAFNITRILNQYPDYSVFNDLLTRTGLAPEINRRSTITVLAVKNGQIGDLSGRPIEVAESILRTHVVLDYFDLMKLNRLKDHTAKLTTMYQQTGVANYDQGFLNVTSGKDGIIFGSAVKNAQHDARLEESVMNRPYNISVLSISHPIVTPGLDGNLQPVAAPPPKSKSPTPAPAPAPGHKKKAAPTPAPAEAPVEADAPAPAADFPDDSPAASPADGPDAADGPEADDDEASDSKSSAGKSAGVSLGGFFLLLGVMVAAQ